MKILEHTVMSNQSGVIFGIISTHISCPFYTNLGQRVFVQWQTTNEKFTHIEFHSCYYLCLSTFNSFQYKAKKEYFYFEWIENTSYFLHCLNILPSTVIILCGFILPCTFLNFSELIELAILIPNQHHWLL